MHSFSFFIYVDVCVYVCGWDGGRVGCEEWRGWFSRRLEEYVQFARVEIKGGCKPPVMGAGN